MSLTRRGLSQLAARRMRQSNYPDATPQLPCNFIPANPPCRRWRCNCLALYHQWQLQQSDAVRCRRDWRRSERTPLLWTMAKPDGERWNVGVSILSAPKMNTNLIFPTTRFFSHRVILTRLGHLLSVIPVAPIFAFLPGPLVNSESSTALCNGAILQLRDRESNG